MKGFELVKREDHWALYNEDGHKIASTLDGCNSKLSIKNCEAIENGYDLDELASQRYIIKNTGDMFMPNPHEVNNIYRQEGFKEGFQKALSILGDKKFSETELYRAFLINSAGDDFTLNQFFNRTVLPMFQQTEWDVEIVTKPYTEVGEDFELESKREPKFNADGCLILKRI